MVLLIWEPPSASTGLSSLPPSSLSFFLSLWRHSQAFPGVVAYAHTFSSRVCALFSFCLSDPSFWDRALPGNPPSPPPPACFCHPHHAVSRPQVSCFQSQAPLSLLSLSEIIFYASSLFFLSLLGCRCYQDAKLACLSLLNKLFLSHILPPAPSLAPPEKTSQPHALSQLLFQTLHRPSPSVNLDAIQLGYSVLD